MIYIKDPLSSSNVKDIATECNIDNTTSVLWWLCQYIRECPVPVSSNTKPTVIEYLHPKPQESINYGIWRTSKMQTKTTY